MVTWVTLCVDQHVELASIVSWVPSSVVVRSPLWDPTDESYGRTTTLWSFILHVLLRALTIVGTQGRRLDTCPCRQRPYWTLGKLWGRGRRGGHPCGGLTFRLSSGEGLIIEEIRSSSGGKAPLRTTLPSLHLFLQTKGSVAVRERVLIWIWQSRKLFITK